MNDIISKAVFSGLGFASLTGDAIRKTASDLVKRSKLSETEGKRMVKDFQRRSAVMERSLKRNVDTAVKKALKQLDLERIPHSTRSTKSNSKRQTTHGKGQSSRSSKSH